MSPDFQHNETQVQTPELSASIDNIVPVGPPQAVVEDWFAKLIHHLKLKQIPYNTKTLTSEEAESIEDFATGQFSKAWGRDTSEMTHRNFVAQLLEHVNEISRLPVKQLGFEWHE